MHQFVSISYQSKKKTNKRRHKVIKDSVWELSKIVIKYPFLKPRLIKIIKAGKAGLWTRIQENINRS